MSLFQSAASSTIRANIVTGSLPAFLKDCQTNTCTFINLTFTNHQGFYFFLLPRDKEIGLKSVKNLDVFLVVPALKVQLL